MQVITECAGVERFIHRNGFGMVGCIAVGDMLQRLVADSQVLSDTLAVARLAWIGFPGEQRITAFYERTHVMQPVGSTEVRVVIVCIIRSRALLDQAKALDRVMV